MPKTKWLKKLLNGQPHFVVGSEENPYLLRWYLIPRNSFLNIYLHKFLRDDDDRAFHDHPWNFLSFIVKGSYKEDTVKGLIYRQWLSLAYRRATHRHRVILNRDETGIIQPCWTIVCTGKRIHEWGFWCPNGFVHWQTFTKPSNPGEIGRGCE